MKGNSQPGLLSILALALSLLLASTAAATESETRDAAPAPIPEARALADSTRGASSELRLQDITIEGDVDIPRVLFIESRDHLRDHDYLTQLFLRSAAQVGAETPLRRILHWSPKGEQKPWTP